MNPGGGGCGEPRSHHCTPAWVTRAKLCIQKKKKKEKRERERKEGRKKREKERERKEGRQEGRQQIIYFEILEHVKLYNRRY